MIGLTLGTERGRMVGKLRNYENKGEACPTLPQELPDALVSIGMYCHAS